MCPQQFFVRIDKSDPRYQQIQNAIQQQAGPGGAISKSAIKNLYYTAGGANRAGQTTATRYGQLVERTMQRQPNLPYRVVQQSDRFTEIRLEQVATKMARQTYDFIHFIRVPVRATSRLYIPANLAHVDEFMNALWRLSGLQAFKIAGFQDAQDRSDVIVAWFQDNQHARAVGANFDQTLMQYFSGVYPPGSRSCSAAGLCGWSIEDPSFSVGTESAEYLASWWQSRGGIVT